MVKQLLLAGADRTKKDSNGLTPIELLPQVDENDGAFVEIRDTKKILLKGWSFTKDFLMLRISYRIRT